MHLENLTVMGVSFISVRLEKSKQSATVLEVISVFTTDRIQVGAIKKNLY